MIGGVNPEVRRRESWGTDALNQVHETRREFPNVTPGRRDEWISEACDNSHMPRRILSRNRLDCAERKKGRPGRTALFRIEVKGELVKQSPSTG